MLPLSSFGSTGHDSTRIVFGAAALGGMSQERADTTLAQVADWGINHIDTAASYGESEDRLKPWLATHRSGSAMARSRMGNSLGISASERFWDASVSTRPSS